MIKDGEIKAISLDTNVFHRHAYDLENSLLGSLGQFIGTSIKYLISDIVLNEVKAHITEECLDASRLLKRATKALRISWIVEENHITQSKKLLTNGKSANDIASQRLTSYQEKTQFSVVEGDDNISVKTLIASYFSTSAPFEQKKDKKNEFPDAIALMTLESWAKAEGTIVLLVSNDNGWKQYCEKSSHLLCLDELAMALGLFHVEDIDLSFMFSKLMGEERSSSVKKAIERDLTLLINEWELDPDASSNYSFEAWITYQNVESLSFGTDGGVISSELVDALGGEYVFSAKAYGQIQVNCEFTFEVRDSIDRDYINVGSYTLENEFYFELDFLVTLSDKNIEQADVYNVAIDQFYCGIDFGDVNPWDHSGY